MILEDKVNVLSDLERPCGVLVTFPFLIRGRKLLNVPLAGGVNDVFPDSPPMCETQFVGIDTLLL